jgi:hypothetical protein
MIDSDDLQYDSIYLPSTTSSIDKTPFLEKPTMGFLRYFCCFCNKQQFNSKHLEI